MSIQYKTYRFQTTKLRQGVPPASRNSPDMNNDYA